MTTPTIAIRELNHGFIVCRVNSSDEVREPIAACSDANDLLIYLADAFGVEMAEPAMEEAASVEIAIEMDEADEPVEEAVPEREPEPIEDPEPAAQAEPEEPEPETSDIEAERPEEPTHDDDLTENERKVYEAVRAAVRADPNERASLTMNQLTKRSGVASGSIFYICGKLSEKGLIHRREALSRGQPSIFTLAGANAA